MVNRLKELKSVKFLRVSLVLAIKDEESVTRYFKSLRLNKDLESYSLVFSGNELTAYSLSNLQSHLSKVKLNKL